MEDAFARSTEEVTMSFKFSWISVLDLRLSPLESIVSGGPVMVILVHIQLLEWRDL